MKMHAIQSSRWVFSLLKAPTGIIRLSHPRPSYWLEDIIDNFGARLYLENDFFQDDKLTIWFPDKHAATLKGLVDEWIVKLCLPFSDDPVRRKATDWYSMNLRLSLRNSETTTLREVIDCLSVYPTGRMLEQFEGVVVEFSAAKHPAPHVCLEYEHALKEISNLL